MSYSPEDNIKAYMQEVGRIPLIDRQEENRLAANIARGCEKSRRLLIISNLRLVIKIAHDFEHLGLPLLDLVAEGNVGLMHAAEKFDPNKGAKFSSYASWWIKQSMRRAVNNQSKTVRIPPQSASKLQHIRREYNRLKEETGGDPSNQCIAESLGYSERTVRVLRNTANHCYYFSEFLKQGETSSNYEEVFLPDQSQTPDQKADWNEFSRRIISALKQLDEREQTIIVKRFGLDGYDPCTLNELTEAIGRTRERVRQIQHEALRKLKKILDEGDQ